MATQARLSREDKFKGRILRAKGRLNDLELNEESKRLILKFDAILSNTGKSLAYRLMALSSLTLVAKHFPDKPLTEVTEDEFLIFFEEYRNSGQREWSKTLKVAKACLERKKMSLAEVKDFVEVNEAHARTIIQEVLLKYQGFEKEKGDTIYLKATPLAKVREDREQFKGYSPQSVGNIIANLKVFLRTMNHGEMPDSVKNLKQGKPVRRVKPEDILSPTEIQLMIECSDNARDKCMLSVLYETGCRAGELLALKIKDFEPQPNKEGGLLCYKASLRGKTGERTNYLVQSIPFINGWLEFHPFRKNKDASMWPSIGAKPSDGVSMNSLRATIFRAQKKAQMEHKKIYPHLFRHSRATHLAEQSWTEPQLRIQFGWTNASPTPSTYIHMTSLQLKNKVLEENGLLDEGEKRANPIKKCELCGHSNPSYKKFCLKCGVALDVKTVMEQFSAEKMEQEATNRLVEMLVQLKQKHPDDMNAVLKRLKRSKIGLKENWG